MATRVNIIIDQGTDFSTAINLTDSSGTDLNLTGYSAASQIRKTHSSSNSTAFTCALSVANSTLTSWTNINNPDADAGPINNYLKSNVQTIRFDNKKFGYEGGIVFDSEKGTQTLVDKPGLEAGRLKDPESGSKGSFGGKELPKPMLKP